MGCCYPKYIPIVNQATTDPDNPPKFVKLKNKKFPKSFVEKSKKYYQDLQPRRFDKTPQEVYDEVKRVILAEKNYKWKLYNEVPEEYKIEFVAISKKMKFKDDVIVVIEADPKGGSIVHARSKSRIGIGDMNVNHDRLIYLLNQLFKDENAKEPQKEKLKDADKSNSTS
jgi:uncharacterized protein (DUF1499 family)